MFGHASWAKFENAKFVIWGADGDPDYFSEPIVCVVAHRAWFQGRLPVYSDREVYLLQARGGRHDGELIAVSSRTNFSIPRQLADGSLAAVVVHRFRGAEGIKRWQDAETDSIGMAALELADSYARRARHTASAPR